MERQKVLELEAVGNDGNFELVLPGNGAVTPIQRMGIEEGLQVVGALDQVKKINDDLKAENEQLKEMLKAVVKKVEGLEKQVKNQKKRPARSSSFSSSFSSPAPVTPAPKPKPKPFEVGEEFRSVQQKSWSQID